jgi:hypothetical protein
MFKSILQYVVLVFGIFLIYPAVTVQQYIGVALVFFVGVAMTKSVVSDIIMKRDFFKAVQTVKDAEDWSKATDHVLNMIKTIAKEEADKVVGKKLH